MGLPFLSNTVTIELATSDTGDKWEAPTYAAPVTGVDCIISNTDPQEVQTTQGNSQIVDTILHLERTVDINRGARVTDEDNGEVYQVVFVHDRTGLGLDRRRAGLIRKDGAGG
jgi:hypothetical protein